jgi:formylglycine-generating enzyme required for sulfatase activity
LQTGKTYRLPTEAEREFAARAGTTSATYWGDAAADTCGSANVLDSSTRMAANQDTAAVVPCADGFAGAAPVGHFAANGFGLFDMLGNVWEWTCSDYHQAYDKRARQCRNDGTKPVLRGGAWQYGAGRIRAANRNWSRTEVRIGDVGFRVALDR